MVGSKRDAVMLKANPKISVVMAVHNDELYFEKSLNSILSQTIENFELIVVDDFSTDRTTEILSRIKDERVKVERNEERKGLTLSLNLGLKKAKGKYVARLDSDDLALPDRLEYQSLMLDRNESVDLLASACSIMDSRGKCLHLHRTPTNKTSLKWLMIFRNPIRHSTAMWRNNGMLYNPSFTYSQDYEMWCRMKSVMASERIVGSVRVHDNAISSLRTKEQDEFAVMVTKFQLEKYFEREMTLEQARGLRSMCVHKNAIQHRHFIEMSFEEKESTATDYMELLDKFIAKESPDLGVLRGEVLADLEGVVKTEPSLKAIIRRLTA